MLRAQNVVDRPPNAAFRNSSICCDINGNANSGGCLCAQSIFAHGSETKVCIDNAQVERMCSPHSRREETGNLKLLLLLGIFRRMTSYFSRRFLKPQFTDVWKPEHISAS